MNHFHRVLLGLLASAVMGYLLLCGTLYFIQRAMIFPADLAAPVPADWQPSAGTSHEQALLAGRCGTLHAVLWRVADEKGTVMVFHGNGESVANVESQVAMFHELGYGVMTWDYPGYGKSTSCWFNEHDLVTDADTVYRWLARRTPESNIVLYGHSVGTGLALYVASHHPNHRVLLVSPYDEMTNVVRDYLPVYVPIDLLIRYPLPADRWIGQVRGSIHALHGLADTLILPSRAAALLQHANGNADIEWVAGADHQKVGEKGTLRRWLEKQLLKP